MDIQIKPQPFTKNRLAKLKQDLRANKIRRFAAIVDHQKLNFTSNALIAWSKQSINKELSAKLKEKSYISHIYLRKTHRLWPYGLYTMVHAKSKEELNAHVNEISELLGGCEHKTLTTIKEFKKTSFNPQDVYSAQRSRQFR